MHHFRNNIIIIPLSVNCKLDIAKECKALAIDIGNTLHYSEGDFSLVIFSLVYIYLIEFDFMLILKWII